MILVIAEQRNGELNRATREVIAATRQIAGVPVTVAVLGSRAGHASSGLASSGVDRIVVVEHPALDGYTPDGYAMACSDLIDQLQPTLVFLPHTYQTRDFAPTLAVRLRRTLITDVTSLKGDGATVIVQRPMFQGKLTADVIPQGPLPHLITIQIGAFRADAAHENVSPTPIVPMSVSIDLSRIRQVPEAPFREDKQSVDLSQADRIVAVGRGIKDREHLPLVEQLAQALGAELAASRPICDSGWLPMERQVGSSGQTVAPKLYVAIGISGAIQHLVGMKGARTIVAVNKDKDAPIFEVADYGIVGDLFDIAPALVLELSKN